ncbi:hypothetical protein GCM10010331_00540 [Streptomyces xanthochromogenes]|nr:hypothetical protein GCM10010331_00540 [Streptomyces xanthochromogenes]
MSTLVDMSTGVSTGVSTYVNSGVDTYISAHAKGRDPARCSARGRGPQDRRTPRTTLTPP